MATQITERPGHVNVPDSESVVAATPLEAPSEPINEGQQASWLEAVRGAGVVIGPSLAFHAITIGSLPALLLRRRWWSVAGASALAAYWLAVRPWHLRWGATDVEVAMPLPGDELEPDAGIQMTRAITIDASVEEVWPWLAQIGQERGGFYSYEWLEHLAGCRITNADRVHPEWQQREVGETILLHPASGLRVSRFEPNRVFGIEHWGNYILQPVGDGRQTRLIGRSRTGRGLAAIFYVLCIEIPHVIMERKMLLGIKQRVEAARTTSG